MLNLTVAVVLVALAVSGFLAGWLTGLSESPVVGVLLPLLFTLIAGANGFHFVAKKGTSERATLHLAFATVSFMVACLLGVHVGITARTEPSGPQGWSPSAANDLPVGEIVELSGIGKRLELLGVDPELIRTLESRYVADYKRRAPGVAHETAASVADVDAMTHALKVVFEELQSGGRSRGPAAQDFERKIPVYLGHFDTLKRLSGSSNMPIPEQHYREFLNDIGESNDRVLEHFEGYREGRVLTPPPALNYIPFYTLQMMIAIQSEPLENRARRASPDFVGDDNLATLDDLLRIKTGANQTDRGNNNRSTGRQYSVKR